MPRIDEDWGYMQIYMEDKREYTRREQEEGESDGEEEEILFFEEEDIKSRLEDCTRSLVGRLLTDTLGTLENAMGAIWGHPEGFRVFDHGDNVYKFFFAKEVDVLRIEMGSPWLFKNFNSCAMVKGKYDTGGGRSITISSIGATMGGY